MTVLQASDTLKQIISGQPCSLDVARAELETARARVAVAKIELIRAQTALYTAESVLDFIERAIRGEGS